MGGFNLAFAQSLFRAAADPRSDDLYYCSQKLSSDFHALEDDAFTEAFHLRSGNALDPNWDTSEHEQVRWLSKLFLISVPQLWIGHAGVTTHAHYDIFHNFYAQVDVKCGALALIQLAG